MTGRPSLKLLSCVLAVGVAGCASFYEIPIETPIAAKLDVSAFQRVFIAGFISGGTDDVDGNLETVRLLRSQLRMKSNLRVVDADVLPLHGRGVGAHRGGAECAGSRSDARTRRRSRTRKTFSPTSTSSPTPITGSASARNIRIRSSSPARCCSRRTRRREWCSASAKSSTRSGRRRVEPVREYMERKGFILDVKFIFIDGRSGAQMPGEKFREERLYNQNDNTPALSSYFELMDEMVPRFLNTLSTQKVRGSRVLIK